MPKRYCKFCDRELPARQEGARGRERLYCPAPAQCKQRARNRRTKVALRMLRAHGKQHVA